MSEADSATDLRGVDVAGPPDGKPIVFVHGVMFTRKLWAPQREALADEFRTIVPDLPGHGERAGTDFRLEPALQVVDEVVESAADGEAALVGLSLGGYVATAYANRHPDKVERLVLSGSSANPVGTLETLTRAVSAASQAATRSDLVDRGIEWAAKRWVQRRDVPPEQAAEMVESGFFPTQFGEAGFELAGKDFRRALANYPGPAIVCNGKWDVVNRLGEGNHAEAARDARVEVVDGAGHVVNLEEPAEYTDVVRRFVRTDR